jgi:hypothetical protein
MENNHITAAQSRETLVTDIGKLKQNAVQVVEDVKSTAAAHVDETKQRLSAGFVVGLLFGLRIRR